MFPNICEKWNTIWTRKEGVRVKENLNTLNLGVESISICKNDDDFCVRMKVNYLYGINEEKLLQNQIWAVEFINNYSGETEFAIRINDCVDSANIEIVERNCQVVCREEGIINNKCKEKNNIEITIINEEAIYSELRKKSSKVNVVFYLDFRLPWRVVEKVLCKYKYDNVRHHVSYSIATKIK